MYINLDRTSHNISVLINLSTEDLNSMQVRRTAERIGGVVVVVVVVDVNMLANYTRSDGSIYYSERNLSTSEHETIL